MCVRQRLPDGLAGTCAFDWERRYNNEKAMERTTIWSTPAGGGEAHGRAETVVAFFYAAFGLAFSHGRRTPARSFPPPQAHYTRWCVPSRHSAFATMAGRLCRLWGGVASGEYDRRTQKKSGGGCHRSIALGFDQGVAGDRPHRFRVCASVPGTDATPPRIT
jgi:hypothetical protein